MKIKVSIKDNIEIITEKEFNNSLLQEFSGYTLKQTKFYKYVIPVLPYDCFVLSNLIQKRIVLFDKGLDILKELSKYIQNVPKPSFSCAGENFVLKVPDIYSYKQIILNNKLKPFGIAQYKVEQKDLFDIYKIISKFEHPFLPSIQIDESIELVISKFTKEPTLEELFEAEITELQTLKRNFHKTKNGFDKLGYNFISDLLLQRPIRYQDRTKYFNFYEAPFGQTVLFKGIVQKVYNYGKGAWDMSITDFDLKVSVNIHFFGGAFYAPKFKVGDVCFIEGIKTGIGKMTGIKAYSEKEILEFPVLPVYKQSPTNKITSELLLTAVREIFNRYENFNLIPYIDLDSSLWNLLKNLHLPQTVDSYLNAVENLAFLELVYLQLLFLDKKSGIGNSGGIVKKTEGKIMKQAISELPFELTQGQQQAIEEIIKRLNSKKPESVLLTADVGAGKTLVGHSVSVYTVESGYQVAMLAPTEILARQLYSTLKDFTENTNIKTAYYRGVQDKDIFKQVEDGKIDIVVGTHSVLNLEFKKLGLIVIDEEQKFGTEHRERLLSKGYSGKKPDVISQTATPIPRTTALSFYGDLDFVPIYEKPEGRQTNITKWIHEDSLKFLKNKKSEELKLIFEELKNKHKVFILCPAVEESKQMVSVKDISKLLKSTYSNLKIEEIHGKTDKKKQEKIIEDFRNGDTEVLIASSIIEVGVDIPKATIMLVLDAHRFGASSLHQIRGRVGRSDLQGYCFLVSNNTGYRAERRLSALENSDNGFDIAVVDLETRKEGDLLGLRQSGESILRFCNLVDHSDLIYKAQNLAKKIYNSKYKEKAIKDAKLFLVKQ